MVLGPLERGGLKKNVEKQKKRVLSSVWPRKRLKRKSASRKSGKMSESPEIEKQVCCRGQKKTYSDFLGFVI